MGDNFFYVHGLPKVLKSAAKLTEEALIFGYRVSEPEHYEVVEFNECGNVISLDEKPKRPKSNFAVPGIYFYDGTASDIAKKLKPSDKGELEITDLDREYLKQNLLKVELLGQGYA